jgi:hypothetical protein
MNALMSGAGACVAIACEVAHLFFDSWDIGDVSCDSGAPQRHAGETTMAEFSGTTIAGFGHVILPNALVRKLPNAPTDWAWQCSRPAASAGMSGSGHRPAFTCMSR